MRTALLLLLSSACATHAKPPVLSPAQPPKPPETIDSKTAKLEKLGGLFPLYWSADDGKLYLRITSYGDFIYVTQLASGVGSNPVGLDRGDAGTSHLVHFERIGDKVLLVETNPQFTATTTNPAERRAVEDSFARSVLWGGKVEIAQGTDVLVDATDLFVADLHGIARRIAKAHQGTYTLDPKRSAIARDRTRAFPGNDEVEAILTFEGHDPGDHVSAVVPWPQAITVREHHSLVALPAPGFEPRLADPRVGTLTADRFDYGSPFTSPIDKHFALRHRMERGRPLVYYVDPGAPPEIRAALIEGASWWSAAFAAAGLPDAFVVEELPPDADPMDIRYNVINWVHRAERGWSYGASIVDPRTGEILKGSVVLDSLRIRHDVDIAAGLGAAPPTLSAIGLARLRQLAAHEVGHTLGLLHNFAAGRASVMDYPSPRVAIVGGKLDFANAYGTGIGAYDTFAIRFLYGPDADRAALLAHAPLYITDGESRGLDSAHPQAAVWDDQGEPATPIDAVAQLKHELDVRRIALAQFGAGNLPLGTPLAMLEDLLVPLQLHHRFQLEAAARTIGGVVYHYAVAGDPAPAVEIVAAKRQRDALALVLSTLEPAELEVPQRIADLIPPRGDVAVTTNTELFEHVTSPVFDPTAAAMAAADIALAALLEPHRAARLDRFHAEDAKNPSFVDVLDGLVPLIARTLPGTRGHLVRATARLVVARLIELARSPDTDGGVRAEATDALRTIAARLVDDRDPIERAHRRQLREEIERFAQRPNPVRTPAKLPAVPPGAPI